MSTPGLTATGVLLTLALLGMMALSLAIGRYPLSLFDIWEFVQASIGFREIAPERYALLYNIIVEIRLPRVLAAVLIGAALAISGASFQAVFRNPLVSPGILGVLGGAGFGAALGLMLSDQWMVVQLLAFGMALLAVGFGVFIANLFGPGTMVTLVLGGVISGALFTALLSITKYTADPYNELPSIVYWLMGSLQAVELHHIAVVIVPIIGGIVVLTLLGHALDALSMGDDEARALGVPVTSVRYGVIIMATLVSALSVSIAGIIGWVGLVVPNFVRLVFGPAKCPPAAAQRSHRSTVSSLRGLRDPCGDASGGPVGNCHRTARYPCFHSCSGEGSASLDLRSDRTDDCDGQGGMRAGCRLRARDIHFRVGKRCILNGIDLEIGRCEVMSLLGANGAGKTTLLRILLGLIQPAQGEVFIDDRPAGSLPRREVARSLAYVPQVHMTPFPYTVREVVVMGRLPHKGLLSNPSDNDFDAVQRVLEQLGISHLADRVYSEISGGERQLTLIARALAQQASILFLDEPMANLDFGYQTLLGKHLRGLANDGYTILMSGHDPQLAYSVSTRIGVLVDGRLQEDGKPEDVLTAATMQRLYRIGVESVALAGGRRAFFPTD